MTRGRQRVLTMIAQSHCPVKAYDLLRALPQSTKPPTVYRALDFLMAHGLVHKLSSILSYVACFHPTSRHSECFFLLCSICGEAQEFCGDTLALSIEQAAARAHFCKTRAVLEVAGICAQCRAEPA